MRGRPRTGSHHSVDLNRRMVIVVFDVERARVMRPGGRPVGLEVGVNELGPRGGRVVQMLRRKGACREQRDPDDRDEVDTCGPHPAILQDESAETSSQAGDEKEAPELMPRECASPSGRMGQARYCPGAR